MVPHVTSDTTKKGLGTRFIALCMFLTSAGCAHYPMGLSKEQWEALPPAQQAEYRARQTEIDAARSRAEIAAAADRHRVEQEAAQRERERVQDLYAHARYGDIVTVSINGGAVAFGGKRAPFEPVAFDLVRGETKRVEFVRLGRPDERTKIEMRLSEDGNMFFFDAPARRRVALANDGWDHGRSYQPPEIDGHSGHSEAIGIKIHVQFKRLPRSTR